MNIKEKQKSSKSMEQKIARGYRLKPATHLMIEKIRKLLKSDQDEAIASACHMFYMELKKNASLAK